MCHNAIIDFAFCFLSSGEFQLPLNSVDLAGPIEEWKDLAPVDDGSNQYLGDLCLSLRYVPSSGKLTVAVLEARKLKKMDITGASDPYVKIKLFDSKVKTLLHSTKYMCELFAVKPFDSWVWLVLLLLNFYTLYTGQEDWQEKEDFGEIMQSKSLLEWIFRLPDRRDGHETCLDWCHGE